MPDEVLFLGEDAPRVATALASHLSATQQFGAGLLVSAILVLALVALFDLIDIAAGPRR